MPSTSKPVNGFRGFTPVVLLFKMVQESPPYGEDVETHGVAGLVIEDIASIEYERRFDHGFIDGPIVELFV